MGAFRVAPAQERSPKRTKSSGNLPKPRLPTASEPVESSNADSEQGRGEDSFGRWFLGGNCVGGDPEGIFYSDFGVLCQSWNVSREQ